MKNNKCIIRNVMKCRCRWRLGTCRSWRLCSLRRPARASLALHSLRTRLPISTPVLSLSAFSLPSLLSHLQATKAEPSSSILFLALRFSITSLLFTNSWILTFPSDTLSSAPCERFLRSTFPTFCSLLETSRNLCILWTEYISLWISNHSILI